MASLAPAGPRYASMPADGPGIKRMFRRPPRPNLARPVQLRNQMLPKGDNATETAMLPLGRVQSVAHPEVYSHIAIDRFEAVMNWKLISALGAISLAAVATQANAADLAARPYTKAPPMIAAVYNWSGFYIGANGGYGTSRKCWDPTGGFAPGLAQRCPDATGPVAVGQI